MVQLLSQSLGGVELAQQDEPLSVFPDEVVLFTTSLPAEPLTVNGWRTKGLDGGERISCPWLESCRHWLRDWIVWSRFQTSLSRGGRGWERTKWRRRECEKEEAGSCMRVAGCR
eukprot:768203-Hanusia_phi.AAC.1